jgi:tetratricopeptide (TPR) repeat protein
MSERHTPCSRIFAVRVIDCILCLVLVNSSIPEVLADEPTTEDASRDAARQHYGRGIDLANQGYYSQALQEFQEAYRNRPHYAVLFNIGQAYIALQQPIEAIAALEQYLAQGQEQIPAERLRETAAQIAAVKAQTAEIVLTARPMGASVSVDGKTIGDAPIHEPIRVAAGRHLISARTPDGTEVTRELAPQAGERVTLIIEVPSAAATSKNPRGDFAVRGTAQSPGNSTPILGRAGSYDSTSSGSSVRVSTLGYVLGTVGAVLGAGAVGHYFWNRNRYENWKSAHAKLANDQQASDYVDREVQNNALAGSIQNASHVTVGLAVAGGALLATGITLVIVDRGRRPTVTAEAQDGGRMVSLRADW